MMLSMNDDGIDYGSWDAGSYGHDEDEDEDFDDPSEEEDDGSNVDEDDGDAFDVHAHEEASEDENQGVELDPSAFSSDEAYARALQDAEEREMAARLLALAGINESKSFVETYFLLLFFASLFSPFIVQTIDKSMIFSVCWTNAR